MDLNKKGVTTVMLIVFVFVGLILLVVLGIGVYGFNLVDDTFSQIDFNISNTSFQETYNQTLQPGIEAMTTTVPVLISTGVLLGFILVMMIAGYSVKRINKLWILLDVFIIIVAEVIAVIISSSFRTFMNSSPELLSIFSNTLSAGSRYVLNLPIIVPILGGLVMLMTYLTVKEKEDVQPEGF